MQTPALILLPLLAACSASPVDNAGPATPDGTAPDPTLPPPTASTAEDPTQDAEGTSGGVDCPTMLATMATLVDQLAEDAKVTPQPAPSSMSEEVLASLELTPARAEASHFGLFKGLMITCEPGKALADDLVDPDKRWKTIREELPEAFEECGCMVNREAFLEWIWVTGQHWPPPKG
jgi:hypothetical protein